jgi:hypothetical protein
LIFAGAVQPVRHSLEPALFEDFAENLFPNVELGFIFTAGTAVAAILQSFSLPDVRDVRAHYHDRFLVDGVFLSGDWVRTEPASFLISAVVSVDGAFRPFDAIFAIAGLVFSLFAIFVRPSGAYCRQYSSNLSGSASDLPTCGQIRAGRVYNFDMSPVILFRRPPIALGLSLPRSSPSRQRFS